MLYQGGTGPTRLIEPIIEALTLATEATLVIRGPGIEVYRKDYERLASALKLDGRVICLPSVPSEEVITAAVGANAGIWTLPDLCKNFRYALPNKLFEYLAAGLPILVADYPEARRLVEHYQVGLTFDPYSPASIAAQINQLIDQPELYRHFAQNTRLALDDMQAEQEWQKLVVLYQNLRDDKFPKDELASKRSIFNATSLTHDSASGNSHRSADQ